MKKLWQWFWTGEWPWKKVIEKPSWAGKILVCDLCGDSAPEQRPKIECKTHRLILCGNCSVFHSDHATPRNPCVLGLLDMPTGAERIAYAQRYDAV